MKRTSQVPYGKVIPRNDMPSLEEIMSFLLGHLSRHPGASLSVRDLGRVLARDFGITGVTATTLDKAARRALDILHERGKVSRTEVFVPQHRIRWQAKGIQ